MSIQSKLLSFSAFAIAVTMLMAAATDAQARGFSRSGTVAGPGRSAAFGSHVQAGGGNRAVTRSIQGSESLGVNYDMNRSYDPSTHSVDRSATATTNSGTSYSHNGTTSYDGNGNFSHQSSSTGPRGGEVGAVGSTSVHQGGATHTSTTTGPNGQQVTVDSSSSWSAQ
jgi:hypothetical protein